MASGRKVEAVADTSFLIALQWLELLQTLEAVHSRVLVPNRVWQEFTEGASETELAVVAQIPVLQRAQVSSALLAAAIGASAEGGEAEVIALALEAGIALVLACERDSRVSRNAARAARASRPQQKNAITHVL